jgi:hypothetical protein
MIDYYNEDLSQIVGKTMCAVTKLGNECIEFYSDAGEHWRMFHSQDCCEHVTIEDIVGDLQDLVGSPIVAAECVANGDSPKEQEYPDESFTWTFYKLATSKGYVTIRWYGASNGYYSETASCARVSQRPCPPTLSCAHRPSPSPAR